MCYYTTEDKEYRLLCRCITILLRVVVYLITEDKEYDTSTSTSCVVVYSISEDKEIDTILLTTSITCYGMLYRRIRRYNMLVTTTQYFTTSNSTSR